MKKIVFIISMIFSFNVFAANIEATVNKNIVSQDEVFVFTLTADENVNERPDLSALSPNFKVYSNSVSKSTYVVNGERTSTTKWQIGLSALNEGKQKIPSVRVGNDISNEVSINVLPTGTDTSNMSDTPKYSIRTEVDDSEEWYVQEQIPCDVIITDIGGLQGGEPVFDNSDDWIIKSLGNPDVVSKYVNGVNVREIRFKYILFAQKSGELKIPAVRFNGYKISNDGGGIFTGNIFRLNVGMPTSFGFEEPINLISSVKSINIRPVPSDYPGKWWLPAKKVEIKAEFDDNVEFVEGEAFNREIVMTAVGVIDTQLPEISFKNADFLKQYPQKSIRSNELFENEPVAMQKVVNVYIPERSGELILPSISVDWFNIETGKIEKAEIKEQKIFVKKNPNLKQNTEAAPQEQVLAQTQTIEQRGFTLLQVMALLIGVFVVGILFGFYMFKFNKTYKSAKKTKTYGNSDLIVKKAYANEYKDLSVALISWAAKIYPNKNICTLKDIAIAIDDEDFSKQLNLLMEKLYSQKDVTNWDADAFVTAYKKITKKNKVKTNNKIPLPKLYQ